MQPVQKYTYISSAAQAFFARQIDTSKAIRPGWRNPPNNVTKKHATKRK